MKQSFLGLLRTLTMPICFRISKSDTKFSPHNLRSEKNGQNFWDLNLRWIILFPIELLGFANMHTRDGHRLLHTNQIYEGFIDVSAKCQ